jgi:hypothetical protein
LKIRIRTNLGRVEFPGMPWQCGEVHEVDETLGASLIARGVAEKCPQPEAPRPPKTVAAVPDKPAIAEPKKPEISGTKRTHS